VAASPTASSSANAIALTLTDNAFSQKTITVAAGSKVTFQLSNQGKVPHNMQIAPPDGNFASSNVINSTPELINPGTTATLTWTAPTTPGTYQFRCEVHPTEMTGTITVK
jgi:plastocyanin